MILSLALAIDPSLLAISRQATGNILAISFVVLAAGFILGTQSGIGRDIQRIGAAQWTVLLARPAWSGIVPGLVLFDKPETDCRRKRDRSEESEISILQQEIGPGELIWHGVWVQSWLAARLYLANQTDSAPWHPAYRHS